MKVVPEKILPPLTLLAVALSIMIAPAGRLSLPEQFHAILLSVTVVVAMIDLTSRTSLGDTLIPFDLKHEQKRVIMILMESLAILLTFLVHDLLRTIGYGTLMAIYGHMAYIYGPGQPWKTMVLFAVAFLAGWMFMGELHELVPQARGQEHCLRHLFLLLYP